MGANSGEPSTPVKWSNDSLKRFYRAFHKHGTNWGKVSKSVGSCKTASQCEALYRQHQTFLGIPSQPQLEIAFVAMVTDHVKNLEGDKGSEPGSDTLSEDGGDGPAGKEEENGKSTPKAEDKDDMAAFASPNLPALVNLLPEPSSHKKRARRLFSGDEDDGDDHAMPVQSFMDRWKERHHNDEIGEGVDALLSLASISHASQDQPVSPSAGPTPASKRTGRAEDASSEPEAGARYKPPLSPSMSVGRAVRFSSHTNKGAGIKSPKFSRAGAKNQQDGGRASGAVLGKRNQDPGHVQAVGSAKKGSRQAQIDADLLEQLNPHVLGIMGEGLDMYGYDPSLFSGSMGHVLPFPVDVYNRPMSTMPPLSSRMANQLVRNMPAMEGCGDPGDPLLGDLILPPLLLQQPEGRTRRRKPLPEKYPSSLFTPHKASSNLNQGSQAAGVFLTGGGLNTPNSAAVAAAAASVLSPTGLSMCLPSFLPGGSGLGALGRLSGSTTPGYLGGKIGSTPAPPPMGETGEPQSAPELALRHALSMRCRRWCMYEFMYSAIDRPWFIRNEMSALLQHVCGGGAPVHANRTRGEMAILRSGFGQPRRLSLAFLKEERIKLEAYREHVRRIYDDFSPRPNLEVPSDLPRPLVVGQEVTARHPITRQLNDGVILTVKGFKYRVQFNRSELLTQEVSDVDLMPLDPHLNLPLAAPNRPLLMNGRTVLSSSSDRGAGAARRRNTTAHRHPSAPLALPGTSNGMVQQGKKGDAMSEAEVNCIAEINSILNHKETLVAKLKEMNDESSAGSFKDVDGNHTDNFQLGYTQVVLQLKEVNTQLESRLFRIGSGNAQFSSLAAAALLGGDNGQLLNVGAHGTASPLADVPSGSAVVMKPHEAGSAHAGALSFRPDMPTDLATATAAAGIPPNMVRNLDRSFPEAAALDMKASNGPRATVGSEAGAADVTGRLLPQMPPSHLSPLSPYGAVAGGGLEEPSHLFLSAFNEGRAMVKACRPTELAANAFVASIAGAATKNGTGGSAAGGTASGLMLASKPTPAGATAPPGSGDDEASLNELVTGCVGFLLTLQKCTTVDPFLSISTMDQALEKALQLVQPKHESNNDLFQDAERSMKMLQNLIRG